MKTVSLALAKQLKEAGYPQEAEFYWFVTYFPPELDEKVLVSKEKQDLGYQREGRSIASPTADEILDQLPKEVVVGETEYLLQVAHGIDAKWQLDYRDVNDGQVNAFVEDSLADAAAKMWLYLKKEGLLKDSEAEAIKHSIGCRCERCV